MGKIGAAIAAGLGGALVGGLDQYAEKKLQDKVAKKNTPDTNPKPPAKVIANPPSYEQVFKMRQDQTQTKPSDDSTE
jgi:hypothetical protein